MRSGSRMIEHIGRILVGIRHGKFVIWSFLTDFVLIHSENKCSKTIQRTKKSQRTKILILLSSGCGHQIRRQIKR